jgi:23S rRNA pseudouridine2605 synthase
VEVNGKAVTELGTRVGPDDEVRVNGSLISPTRHVHVLLNKPRGTITTTRDERGRKTVLDLVNIRDRDDLGIFPVGRLDRDTTGALLLTNDGELANRLMHPRYEVEKLYTVHTNRDLTEAELDQLRTGVELDGGLARADRVGYLDPKDHRVVGISLHEGRNRQIRRMMEALGCSVQKLDRVRYAGLSTSGLRRGRWRRLTDHEVKRLYRVVKLKTK